MRILPLVAFCVAVLSLSAPGRADEPKKSDSPGAKSPVMDTKADTALLVGKWVRTDKFVGTTLEYRKDGTYITTSAPQPGVRPIVVPGTWKLDGDDLVQTLGPSKTNASVTVTKLTETEFHFTNRAGMPATYERVVEKKPPEKNAKKK